MPVEPEELDGSRVLQVSVNRDHAVDHEDGDEQPQQDVESVEPRGNEVHGVVEVGEPEDAVAELVASFVGFHAHERQSQQNSRPRRPIHRGLKRDYVAVVAECLVYQHVRRPMENVAGTSGFELAGVSRGARPMKYCHTCGWSVSAADGLTRYEQSQEAIDHFVETGHPIDSTDSPFHPRSPPAAGQILQRTLLKDERNG